MTVQEISSRTGISVRTLHYYDEIGLLKPAQITPAGYRIYDEKSLEKLTRILFFKELDFPLKQIKIILENPALDKSALLADQIKLLTLKRDRLNRILTLAEKSRKGECIMPDTLFNTDDIDRYADEVKKRWGETDAYKEYTQKSGFDPNCLHDIFKTFAEMKTRSADDPTVLAQVETLKTTITENFYTCTDKILASLGEMYTADERFKQNIDRFGDGTAEFVSAAIHTYILSKN